MIETPEDITTIVSRIEEKRTPWARVADDMEDAWALNMWDGESDDERTYVTSSAPLNAINAAMRMVDTTNPRVECPALGFDETDDKNQELKEKWLKALWQRVRVEQNEDVIGSAFWQALVLGRGVFQVLWVRDVLPKRLRDHRMPFLIRTLDPRNAGFEYGSLYLQNAFNKSEVSNLAIKQQFPDYEYDGEDGEEKELIDFWFIEPEDGKVWNAVVVEDAFVMDPMATKYFDIPLVPFSGSYQPSSEEEDRHQSFLAPLISNWETMNDLLTLSATNILYYTVPAVALINENGEALSDEPMSPGEWRQFPAGTSINPITVVPNAPLVDRVLGHIGNEVQESTFTGAASGAAVGSNQAGYSYSAAMAADEGRIARYRASLQTAMVSVNEIVLGLVDSYGGAKGVTLHGKGEAEGGRYVVKLDKETIGGNYENAVELRPALDRDDAARIAMGQRLVDGGTISRQTMRDTFINDDLPVDEQQRIELERAMNNPETAPLVALHTLMAYGSQSPAIQQIIEVLGMQSEAMMAQLQAQQQAPDGQGGAIPPQGPGGPGPVQPPAMAGGALPAGLGGEGQLTQSTFAQGEGEQVSPEVFDSIARGGQ